MSFTDRTGAEATARPRPDRPEFDPLGGETICCIRTQVNEALNAA